MNYELRIAIKNSVLVHLVDIEAVPLELNFVLIFLQPGDLNRGAEILQKIKILPLKLHFKHVWQLYIKVANLVSVQVK